MPKYVSPRYLLGVFTCPHCDVTATQEWFGNNCAISVRELQDMDQSTYLQFSGMVLKDEFFEEWLFSKCSHCGGFAVWREKEIVFPSSCPVEEPNEDMPSSVRERYLEAASVVSVSPASAAAMLRLALQILLGEILQEESTGNIYHDVNKLAKRSLDTSVIKALDIIRIAGNESVHPGTLDLSEDEDDALYLFELMNMVCDQCITQPKRMRDMYERMPESKRILGDDEEREGEGPTFG